MYKPILHKNNNDNSSTLLLHYYICLISVLWQGSRLLKERFHFRARMEALINEYKATLNWLKSIIYELCMMRFTTDTV